MAIPLTLIMFLPSFRVKIIPSLERWSYYRGRVGGGGDIVEDLTIHAISNNPKGNATRKCHVPFDLSNIVNGLSLNTHCSKDIKFQGGLMGGWDVMQVHTSIHWPIPYYLRRLSGSLWQLQWGVVHIKHALPKFVVDSFQLDMHWILTSAEGSM